MSWHYFLTILCDILINFITIAKRLRTIVWMQYYKKLFFTTCVTTNLESYLLHAEGRKSRLCFDEFSL